MRRRIRSHRGCGRGGFVDESWCPTSWHTHQYDHRERKRTDTTDHMRPRVHETTAHEDKPSLPPVLPLPLLHQVPRQDDLVGVSKPTFRHHFPSHTPLRCAPSSLVRIRERDPRLRCGSLPPLVEAVLVLRRRNDTPRRRGRIQSTRVRRS